MVCGGKTAYCVAVFLVFSTLCDIIYMTNESVHFYFESAAEGVEIDMEKQEDKTKATFWDCLKQFFKAYDFSLQVILAVGLGCAIFLLDYYDIPSQIIANTPGGVLWPIACALAVLLVVWLLDLHVFDLFVITSENALDVAATVTILASVFYVPTRMIFLGKCIYTQIAVCLAAALLLIIAIRILVRYCRQKKSDTESSNLIDLKALYEGTFSREENNPVLLREKDIDYDLLNREGIIDKLYRSITHCQPEESYVISLEGDWGTGKTTIINNVKKLLLNAENSAKDYVVIDDFDPWLYGTQEALLLAMFEVIMKHAGLMYSPIRSNMIVRELSKTIADTSKAGGILYSLFYNSRKHGDDVARLKKKLSSYLRNQNKTIVFFVDNLDRANDDNVIFLFKLIGIVFDLPGIVYVLSFERGRIDAILANTKEIDPRFTEKIIQQEIKVPAISDERAKQLYFVCIENLLLSYRVPRDKLTDYIGIAKYVVAMTKNVRTFKRMLNSVFAVVFCDDTLLDKRDLLAMEVIHFYDPELHSSIYGNAKYYISHERDPIDYLHITSKKEEFNKQAKEYFAALFSSREEAKALLADIFPYVKKYTEDKPLVQDSYFPDPDAAEIAKYSRVCDARYFDLYFSYTANNSLRIRKSVETFISKINAGKGMEHVMGIMRDTINSVDREDHKEWMERLQNHLPDIEQKNVYNMAASLYSIIYDISPEKSMWGYGLGPQARAEYIISELLIKCSDEEFDGFLSLTFGGYGKLGVILSICNWLKSDKYDSSEIRKQRAEKLKAHHTAMCERVVNEKINLYSDAYYHVANAWGMYHCYKANDAVESFTDYIKSILSAENVYRVLWDVKTCAIGDNYQYSISDENLTVYLGDIQAVKKLVEENPPRSKDEEFVYQMYNVYCNGEPDVWGHKGVVSQTAVNLNL